MAGALTSILGFLVRILKGNTSKRMVTIYLDWLLLLLPGYAMQTGIMNVAMRKFSGKDAQYFDFWRMPSMLQSSCYNFASDHPFDRHCYYEWKPGCCDPLPTDFVVGVRPLLYLLAEAALLWLCVLCHDLEPGWFRARCTGSTTQIFPCCVVEPVQDDGENIELQALGDSKDLELDSADPGTAAPENLGVVVNQLCKNYVRRNYGCGSSNTTALDLLSFRAHDEVFALLGVTMICALYTVSSDIELAGERRWQDHLYKHLNWQRCDEFWRCLYLR